MISLTRHHNRRYAKLSYIIRPPIQKKKKNMTSRLLVIYKCIEMNGIVSMVKVAAQIRPRTEDI